MIGNIQAQDLEAYLEKKSAYADFREWAKGKDLKTVYDTCPKFEWLASLLKRGPNPTDRQYRMVILLYRQVLSHIEDAALKEVVDTILDSFLVTGGPDFAEDLAADATEKSMDARVAGAKATEEMWAKKAAVYHHFYHGDIIEAAKDALTYGIVTPEKQVELLKEQVDIVEIQAALVV